MKKEATKKTTAKKTPKKPAAKKVIKKVAKKPAAKPKTAKAAKPTGSGMSHFEQCVALAAIIHQLRLQDENFALIPLPDINSSILAPVRELLGQYVLAELDKSAKEVVHSKAFKDCLKVSQAPKAISFKLNPKNNIIQELLVLAGPEVKKTIYFAENAHDIHKTTLEKHALKMGLVTLEHHDPEPMRQDPHQQLLQLRAQKINQTFPGHATRFSGKQHRGRG